jgi:hypothetical protein
MQSNGARAVIILVAIAAVVAGFVILGNEDDDSTVAISTTTSSTTTAADGPTDKNETEERKEPRPAEPMITIKGGEPVDGVAELSFAKGDEIAFSVSSDTADEIHVHGYDVSAEVAPGHEAKLSFPATIDGIFEVELEQSAVEIAKLTVTP